MIKTLLKWIGMAGVIGIGVVPTTQAGQCPALLNYSFPNLQTGKPMPMCQYAGKVMLVVNTASYCGFTNQYDGLEKLYDRLKSRGLVVIGFPSNDFGEQEPGNDKEIADFCRLTYGVEFPMMSKTVVKGPQANAFYKRLTEITGSAPRWNFHKYLISRDGSKVVSFGSATAPDDPALLSQIETFLQQEGK